MRLLVVEDEKKVASFIKKGLEEEGYVVDLTHDGESGLEQALEQVHDLIVEVALRAPRSPEEYRQALRSGLEEIERIASLTAGLLLLAGADAGVLRTDRHPLDLADLVADVHGRVKILAESRCIHLALGRVEPVPTRGDYDRLNTLLLNLLDNGIKYTEPGSAAAEAGIQEGDVILEVN
jgi:signal transduction histidine kinase